MGKIYSPTSFPSLFFSVPWQELTLLSKLISNSKSWIFLLPLVPALFVTFLLCWLSCFSLVNSYQITALSILCWPQGGAPFLYPSSSLRVSLLKQKQKKNQTLPPQNTGYHYVAQAGF